MPEIWWPTTPAETPHVPKNQSNTFSKIQAGPPRRASKSEGRESENGVSKDDFARPVLKANGHQRG